MSIAVMTWAPLLEYNLHVACPLQELMFSLLSATLWLGNIQFQRKTADSVEVVPSAALSTAARLLRVPEERLVFALSKRKITAGVRTFHAILRMSHTLCA